MSHIAYRRQFFAENRYLGQTPALVALDSSWACGTIFVCPHCYDAWARILVPGRQGYPLKAACRKCPPLYRHEIPGSLLTTVIKGDTFPPDAAFWSREFEIHLAYASSLLSDPIAS